MQSASGARLRSALPELLAVALQLDLDLADDAVEDFSPARNSAADVEGRTAPPETPTTSLLVEERQPADVKFVLRRITEIQQYYPFTAIDEATRFRVLRSYDKNSTKSGQALLDEVRRVLPVVILTLQTDLGGELVGNLPGTCGMSASPTRAPPVGVRDEMARWNEATKSMRRRFAATYRELARPSRFSG